ncbi:MAG: vWA domain-containing protein, partial [Nannocystaceae bacterium]
VVLNPTAGNHHQQIMGALDRLSAGGSTNGGQGIELAYKLAQQSFVRGGINRVILATDGDFNVGTTSRNSLERLIEQKRSGGVFLSVLGFGTGNLKDSQMEMLADKGNGNYAYIDSTREAHKVLVDELGSTLVTIAKDVKIQVEFNPSMVQSYRLIGYENRALADRDFNDDRKDAGEIGAGHTVTALYEVVPRGAGGSGVDPLRYQQEGDHTLTTAANSGELMHLKLRYKQPTGSKSTLITYPIVESDKTLAQSSQNFRFSAAVAGFGMLLRNSEHAGETSFHKLHGLAQSALGRDTKGYRREFLNLVKKAGHLRGERPSVAIAR